MKDEKVKDQNYIWTKISMFVNPIKWRFNPVCTRGGADLPDLSRIPKFPYFALQIHAEIGWLFMYVHYGPFAKNYSILGVSV